MSDEQGQRPSFFEKQYLGAADLNAVVDHGRLQMAQHLLGAHTWGIVTGLELVEKPSPLGGGQVDLFVLPGFAWDGFGRPIAVLRPTPVPAKMFKGYDYDSGTDGGTPPGRLIKIWLRYDELPARPPRAGFESCTGGDAYARVQETFRLEAGERTSHSDRHQPITVGGVTDPVDAQQVLQKLDAQTPPVELFDESVPYQDLPDDPRARWLISLGVVRWLPSSDAAKPGRFVNREADDLKKSLSLRHYAGVVAGSVNAPAGSVRLRGRTTAYSDVDSDDLVWVEGDLRVEGDTRLFGRTLAWLDKHGMDRGAPLSVRRSDGVSGAALQVIVGEDSDGDNAFQVGPVDNLGSLQPGLTVRDDGRVGVGGSEPDRPLSIRASGGTEDLISFQDAKGKTKWHINQKQGGKSGLNVSETGVDDGRLFIAAGGKVGIGTTAPKLTLDVRGDLGRTDGPATLHLYGSRIGDAGDGVLSLRSGGSVVAFDGGDRVGIGTATPQAPLDVHGSVRLGTGGKLFAAAGEENLRLLCGTVKSSGEIAAGIGFSVERVDTGLYRITFDESFSSRPSASVTQVFPDLGSLGDGGNTLDNAVLTGIKESEMKVKTGDASGEAANRHFSFIVIGPQ